MMNMYGIFILSIICKIKCLVNVGVATVYLYSMHASARTLIPIIMFDSFAHSIFSEFLIPSES